MCYSPFGSEDIGKPFSASQSQLFGVDVLALAEGYFENGIWRRDRRLNGDEVVITMYKEPTPLRLKLLAYD